MRAVLLREWFLVAVAAVLAVGLPLGASLGPDGVPDVGRFPAVSTAAVLFLMAVSLDSAKLAAAVRRPSAVLLAVAVNAVLMPLAMWPAASLVPRDDLRVGLMIAATVPCTLAAASVWTRRAGGDDAVSLLTTVATNGGCFLVAPFWLATTCGLAVDLDAGVLMRRLLLTAVLPMACGQLVRVVPAVRRFADGAKKRLSTVALATILSVIAVSALKAGSYISALGGPPDATSVVATGVLGAGGHVAALAAAWALGGTLGLGRPQRIGAAIAGSQKTLPVGILIATSPEIATGLPLVAFPMLFVHASQLMIDTVIAGRWAEEGRRMKNEKEEG